jgi:hypothetical protein
MEESDITEEEQTEIDEFEDEESQDTESENTESDDTDTADDEFPDIESDVSESIESESTSSSNEEYNDKSESEDDDEDEEVEDTVLEMPDGDIVPIFEENQALKPLSLMPQQSRRVPVEEVIETLPAVFDIRLMKFEEIQEINKYVITNIPYSVLQQLFILAEAPLSKAEIFTAVYRIIYSARNAASSQNTKNKLDLLLSETKDAYNVVFALLMNYKHTNQSFNHHRYMNKIIGVFCEVDTNLKINKLIDAFLVFAEKQELYDINKILGLDLETDSGKKIMGDIMSGEAPRQAVEE